MAHFTYLFFPFLFNSDSHKWTGGAPLWLQAEGKQKIAPCSEAKCSSRKSQGAAAPSLLRHMISREAWTKENKSFLKERQLILEWLSDLVDDYVWFPIFEAERCQAGSEVSQKIEGNMQNLPHESHFQSFYAIAMISLPTFAKGGSR